MEPRRTAADRDPAVARPPAGASEYLDLQRITNSAREIEAKLGGPEHGHLFE